jgi:hypothetical protein
MRNDECGMNINSGFTGGRAIVARGFIHHSSFIIPH